MVVTFAPSTCQTNTVQDLTALPSTCTTQAPHCDVSQPTWVPVSRRFSRRNCTRRVRGSMLALTGLPFTIREILAIQHSFHLYRRVARQHSPQIVPTIIWAKAAIGNLGCRVARLWS